MKAAIFDMDGTLLNSMPMWRSLAPAFSKEHGIDWTDELGLYVASHGFFGSAEYFVNSFPELGMNLDEIVAIWCEMAQNGYQTVVEPKSGALEYLRYLKENSIPCVVATMSYHLLADAALARHGIDKLVKAVITPEKVGHVGKDRPDIFLAAARLLGFAPSECVVFEDSLFAMSTAKKAGFTVYGIDDVLNNTRLETEKLCDLCFSDYRELMQGVKE